MAKLSIQAGTTSKLLRIFVQNSSVTTGAGLTGLAFGTSGLTGYYIREGASSTTQITLATAILGTWSTGGFIVVDGTNMPGVYEIGIPNAAIASGAASVVVYFQGATSMAPVVLEIELTAVNNQSTGFGLVNASANVVQIAGSAVSATTAQLGVNVVNWNNTVVATPATAGIPDINVKNINNATAATPGASGGILISGSNSGTTTFGALTVTGSATISDGLLISRSTSNTSAITATGNGTGSGAVFTSGGGATGDGVKMTAASTAGNGISMIHSGTGKDLNATTTPLILAKTTNITGFNDIAASAVVSSGAITTSGGAVSTVTTVTNQLTAAAIASGVWKDATAGDFTTASSIGKSLYTSGNAPGAASGLFIAGTNAATTITTGLTTTFTGDITGSVGSVTAQVTANVTDWNGTAVGTIPPDAIFIHSGTAQAGGASTITLDAGASATNNLYQNEIIFILSGTGAGQSNIIASYNGSTQVATVAAAWATNPDNTSVFSIIAQGPTIASVSGTVTANVTQWNGSAVATPNIAGTPVVDVGDWLGTAVTAATAGIPDTNVKNINNVSTGSVTTINANQGTTQPINFSGTGSSAFVKSDTEQLNAQTVTAAAGVTFPASVASPTNITAGTITTVTNLTNAPAAGDFTSTMKTSLNAATPASVTGAVGSVTGNVGGNVVGSVGSVTGLTASNLDTTISSRMATYMQPTGFLAATFPTGTIANTTNITAGTITTATNLTNAPTSGDFTAAMKTSLNAATPASVVGAVGSVTGNVGGNVTGSVGSVTSPVGITSNRKKGATATFEFLMQNSTTGAPQTGLTVTMTISKDGGSSVSTTNAVTEIGLGQYQIVLTSGEMTANNIFLQGTATGALTFNLSVQTAP